MLRAQAQSSKAMFFTLFLGGSLGPEAALLALCGAAVSGVASGVFGFRGKRLRECALMGMTAGLAAFFGVALGGSLFALEVLHPTLAPIILPNLPLINPALHYHPTLEAPVTKLDIAFIYAFSSPRNVLLEVALARTASTLATHGALAQCSAALARQVVLAVC